MNLKDAVDLAVEFDGGPTEFYHTWWSGQPDFKFAQPEPMLSLADFHHPIPTRVLSVTGGFSMHSTGYSIHKIRSGNWIDAGDEKGLVLRKKHWETSYWVWEATSLLDDFQNSGQIRRFYIPSSEQAPSVTAGALVADFESCHLPVTLKYRKSESPSSDCIVIWVCEEDVKTASKVIENHVNGLIFTLSAPPLTYSWQRVGVADHPDDGGSLGMRLATAIWKFAKNPSEQSLSVYCEQHSINLEAPWILQKNTDASTWARDLHEN